MNGSRIYIIIFFCSYVSANISSIENNFIYYQKFTIEDTIINAEEKLTPKPTLNDYKSASKAMVMSGLIPGTGQAYLGQWKRTAIYGIIEALALGTWYRYNKSYNDEEKKYRDYAGENWKFSTWIKDYYKWDNTSESVAFTDAGGNYPYIWEGSHYVSFTWDEDPFPDFVKTTDESVFKYIYMHICDNSSLQDKFCSATEGKIEEYDIEIIRDHNFYENIGKYDSFFAGWEDNDDIEVYEKSTEELLAISNKKWDYRKNMFEKAEEYYDVAGYALSVLLTNHVVSMIDALISAKSYNKRSDFTITPYYDHRNKWGIGGFTIRLNL